MKLWTTELKAICQVTNELRTFCGPNVPGITWEDAEHYCQNNGLGYCKVTGELIAEIPCRPGTFDPDFSKIVDYEKPSQN